MNVYKVRIIEEAKKDLTDIFDYIARKDSVDNAYYVLDNLETLILSLDKTPQRRHYPPELKARGIKDYKEVHFKPYRVIYEIIGAIVVILGCFDGRRGLQKKSQNFWRPLAGAYHDDRFWFGTVVKLLKQRCSRGIMLSFTVAPGNTENGWSYKKRTVVDI